MKKPFITAFPTMACFLLCSITSTAQWTEVPSPSGASIHSRLEVMNGKVYTSNYTNSRVQCAITHDYIHWSLVADFPADFEFGTSRVLLNGNQLYLFGAHASQQTAAAWLSDDEGQSWQGINLPAPKPYLLAPVDDVLLASSQFAVQRSEDGGANWNNVLTMPERALAMQRLNDQTVWLATTHRIYRSMDQGLTWDSLAPPYDATGVVVPVLNIFPVQEGLFIEFRAGSNSTLFRTYDYGLSWTTITTPSLHNSSAVQDLHSFDGVLWGAFAGGIATSDDAGETWEFQLTPYGTRQLAHHGDVLFAGGYSGFFKTYDHGLSWLSGNLGWEETGLYIPGIDYGAKIHAVQSKLYFSTRNGLFSTTNDGIEWRLYNNYGPFSYLFHQGDTLVFLERGAMHSFDGGASWNHTSSDDFMNPLYGNYKFTRINDDLYALPWFNNFIYHSADFGASWQSLPAPASFLRYIASASNTLYLGNSSSILASTDSGLSFQPFHQGLGNSLNADGIWSAGEHIFLHAQNQLWRRDGNLWKPASIGLYNDMGSLPFIYNVKGDTDNALLVGIDLAASRPSLYLSADGGISWEGNWADGLPNIDFGFDALLHEGTIYAIGEPDGQFTLRVWKRSLTVATHEPAAQPAFKLFPNPARNAAWLTFDGMTHIPGRIVIHDFTGRLVWQRETAGESIIEIPLHQRLPGIYSISLFTANGQKIQGKLVVH
jgi:photosystem II stability/assembly factor-like uncharacterized protein